MMKPKKIEAAVKEMKIEGASLAEMARLVAANNGAPSAPQAEKAATSLARAIRTGTLNFLQQQEERAKLALGKHRKCFHVGKGANAWRGELKRLGQEAHNRYLDARRQKEWEEEQRAVIDMYGHGRVDVLEEALEGLFEGLSKGVEGRRQVKAARKVLFPGIAAFPGDTRPGNSWREFYNHPED